MWLIVFLLIIIGVWLSFGRRAAGNTILIAFLCIAIGFIGLIVWLLIAYPSPSPKSLPNTQNTTISTQGIPLPTVVQNVTATPSVGTLPTVVGQCDITIISQIGTRLMDGLTNNPIPGTGSAIWYADGGYQVSYDTVQGIVSSQVGDQVNLCLISVPDNCPFGDNRGWIYKATNLRTGDVWSAGNSEHSCGGA